MVAKKNKLVFFDFVTHFGGAQQCTVLLCKALKQFYDVYVIDAYGSCDKYTNALADIGITVRVLMPDSETVYIGYKDKRFRRIFRAFRQFPSFLVLRKRLEDAINHIDPDLVWVNGIKPLTFLAMIGTFRKFPVAMYAHGWYKKSQLSWFRRWLIKHCADCVLAVSNPTKEALEGWGVPENKIHVVFNTIDFDNILEGASKEPVMPLPGMDKNYKILLPGLLARTKGQHVAIKAAGLLKRKGLDFVMWLAGDVSVGDKSGYRENLLEQIQANGLEENIFLLGWRSDVQALMSLSDVVVLPTLTEGLPRAVQEAMILRRPVISTPVGGITDLIINGETGLLVSVDDENALAQGLEKVMLDKAFACQLAEKGHKHMCENFCTDRQIDLVREAFQCEIAKKQGKSNDK